MGPGSGPGGRSSLYRARPRDCISRCPDQPAGGFGIGSCLSRIGGDFSVPLLLFADQPGQFTGNHFQLIRPSADDLGARGAPHVRHEQGAFPSIRSGRNKIVHNLCSDELSCPGPDCIILGRLRRPGDVAAQCVPTGRDADFDSVCGVGPIAFDRRLCWRRNAAPSRSGHGDQDTSHTKSARHDSLPKKSDWGSDSFISSSFNLSRLDFADTGRLVFTEIPVLLALEAAYLVFGHAIQIGPRPNLSSGLGESPDFA